MIQLLDLGKYAFVTCSSYDCLCGREPPVTDEPPSHPPATAVVTLDGCRHEICWPRAAKLLDVLLDKGLDAPFSCREGHCGACAVLKTSGEVEMAVNDVLEPSDLADGLILGCQATPVSDSVEITYDE